MKRISIILGCIVLLIVGILVIINQDQEQILVEENTKNENTSLVFMLQEDDGTYSKSDSLPSNGYNFNATKSVCSNGATPTWEDNRLYLNNLTSNGTSCYLYFDIKPLAMNTILANKIISDERSGAITGLFTTNTTGIVYRVEDDWGDSYIFAGAPTDNWLYFANYYWRIIRINGDGSIRLIYSGNKQSGPSEIGENTQIGTSPFNEQNTDNAYVGYMYGSIGASSYASTHTNTNNSSVKILLDNWYLDNLLQYAQYISTEAGFCNDRNLLDESDDLWSSDTKLGYGDNETAYGIYKRLVEQNHGPKKEQIPSLKCVRSNDLFTVDKSSKGNHDLVYPIGLITGDEVVLAGSFFGNNSNSYYLYTNQSYWTMTPFIYDYAWSRVLMLNENGGLNYQMVNNGSGVRPVINLSADVSLSGTGTMSDPYVVEGAE